MHYYQYIKDMKVIGIISFFVAALFAAPVLCQTQQGYVKTKGRLTSNETVISGSRISGVTVQVKGRSAVLSQSNGTFSFPITSQSYYLQSVQKQGYVLTDPEVLSKQYAYSKNPLVLVLETPSQQLDDKLAMEKKIRRTLRRQLQDKEDEIESLKEQQKLTEDEYRRQLQEIYDQQENNEKLISEMADRYSKMDFDEKDEFNRRISSLIIEGKLTEADSLLNTKGDINRRAETLRQHQEANAQAEQEIKKKQKNLEKSKVLAQKELEDLAQDCYSKFEIFKMQHQNDSAAYYLKLRSNLDTTFVQFLLDYSSFISSYMGDFNTAKDYNIKALDVALSNNVEKNLIAECYRKIGLMYSELGDYERSTEYLLNGLEAIDSINAESILPNLYNDLGVVYDNKREFDLAIQYYKKSLEIREQIFGTDSESVAMSYNNLGYIYSEIGNYEDALEFYSKALDIQRKLFGEEHEDVGMTYINIGGIYLENNDAEQALRYFTSGQKILETYLSPTHPKVGLGYNNIATAYQKLNNYEMALKYSEKAIDNLEMSLGQNHPYVAIIYGNTATIYEDMGRLNDAIEYNLQAISRLTSAYGEDSPNSIQTAVHYGGIGRMYKKAGKYDLAEESLLKCLEIEKKILRTPNIYLYNGYKHLAEFYYEQELFKKAINVYTEMLDVTISVFGPESENTTNNYGLIYFSLIAEYQQTKTKEDLEAFLAFMRDHAITVTVVDESSPASIKGMKGEYYLLALESWEMLQPSSIVDYVKELQGKPKNIIVMKDDIISKYYFEDSMGLKTGFKYIDKEKANKIAEKYYQWKKKNQWGL